LEKKAEAYPGSRRQKGVKKLWGKKKHSRILGGGLTEKRVESFMLKKDHDRNRLRM